MRALIDGSSDRARLQRDALAAFSIRVASAALLYLSQIFIARWLGSFEYGIYVFVWTWAMVLGGLSTLGFGTALIRLVPAYRGAGQDALLRGVLRYGRLIPALFATLVASSGLLALHWLGDRIASHFILPVFLALFCVPMLTISEVLDGVGRAHSWMIRGLFPHYIIRPLLLLGGMIAATSLGYPATAATAAAVAVGATWLAAILQIALVQGALRAALPAGPSERALRSWLATAMPLLVIGGCELLIQNTDVLVLSRFLTPNEVAMYFAAAKTMGLVLFVHYAVGSAIANRYAAIGAQGDRSALADFARDAVNWTFWPSLAAAGAILLLGRWLLSLFGPAFVEAYPVMWILSVGLIVRAAIGPAEFLLNMLGEQVLCAGVLVVTAVTNVALAFALVPTFGMFGAAAATSLSWVVCAGLLHVVARRRLELEIAIWSNVADRPPG